MIDKAKKRRRGFIGTSIIVFKKCIEDDIVALASQLSYNFLLALFPFLIFLMTLVGYSSLKSQDVLYDIERDFPSDIFIYIKRFIVEVVDKKRISLMSISLIFTIFAASGAFAAIIKGLNKAYHLKEDRGFLKIELVTLICTIGLALMTLINVIFLVFGHVVWNMMVKYMGIASEGQFIWDIIRYVFAFISMFIGFAVLYRYTPARKPSLRSVLPGSLFTAVSWNIVSLAFSLYIDNFANYSLIYGSLGAVIMLLTWLLIISALIILGGEINAARSNA